MPVPMVLGIGICASRQQTARDRHESNRSFWHVVMQASMADVKKRFPILNSARLQRRFGMLLQACLHCLCVTEHDFREEIGVFDGGVQRQRNWDAADWPCRFLRRTIYDPVG